MKTCFHIKLNLGNYQSAEFGVDDFDGSLEDAKMFVLEYINHDTNIKLDSHAMEVFANK